MDPINVLLLLCSKLIHTNHKTLLCSINSWKHLNLCLFVLFAKLFNLLFVTWLDSLEGLAIVFFDFIQPCFVIFFTQLRLKLFFEILAHFAYQFFGFSNNYMNFLLNQFDDFFAMILIWLLVKSWVCIWKVALAFQMKSRLSLLLEWFYFVA